MKGAAAKTLFRIDSVPSLVYRIIKNISVFKHLGMSNLDFYITGGHKHFIFGNYLIIIKSGK